MLRPRMFIPPSRPWCVSIFPCDFRHQLIALSSFWHQQSFVGPYPMYRACYLYTRDHDSRTGNPRPHCRWFPCRKSLTSILSAHWMDLVPPHLDLFYFSKNQLSNILNIMVSFSTYPFAFYSNIFHLDLSSSHLSHQFFVKKELSSALTHCQRLCKFFFKVPCYHVPNMLHALCKHLEYACLWAL